MRPLLAALLLLTAPALLAADLNGHWQGRYIYPDGRSNAFTVDLAVNGEQLTGTMTEAKEEGGGKRLSALQGTVNGKQVRFHKQYNTASGWDHAVQYEGTLNAKGTVLTGQWRLPTLSGAFEMSR